MSMSDDIPPRAAMEVIQNEVNRVIQRMQSGRYQNILRALEGVMYFVRYVDNNNWKKIIHIYQPRICDLCHILSTLFDISALFDMLAEFYDDCLLIFDSSFGGDGVFDRLQSTLRLATHPIEIQLINERAAATKV